MQRLLLALLILACQGPSPSTPVAAPARDPVAAGADAPGPPALGPAEVATLRLDETVVVGELHLRWLELADSRCPIGVTCIWEGQATVTFEAWRAGETPSKAELLLRSGAESAGAIPGYELTLRSVEPYPRSGVTPERDEYVATVEIRLV